MSNHILKRKGTGQASFKAQVQSRSARTPNVSIISGGSCLFPTKEAGVLGRTGCDGSFVAKPNMNDTPVISSLGDSCNYILTSAKIVNAQSMQSLREPLSATSVRHSARQQKSQLSAERRDRVSSSPKHKRDHSARNVERQKRLCQYPTSYNNPNWCLEAPSDLPGYQSLHPFSLPSGPEDEFALFNVEQSARREPKLVSFASASVPTDNDSSVRDAAPSHPLSSLKWPFDEVGSHTEYSRGGGGGGGTQPSTTGSQGFPQFVTAGPAVSLFDHRIFGYEREDTILWA